MPTILQIAALHPQAQERLERDYTVLRHDIPAVDAAWIAQHGEKVEGVVTGGHLGIPPAMLGTLPKLKIVGINGVGYDRVDLDLARSRGVRVSNTPDVLTDDVADLAIGLTLALLRRLPHAHAHVQAGKWGRAEMGLATKLSGKRVGIFGLGRIGRAVAKRFTGFTDIIGYTDIVKQDVAFTYYPDAVALARVSDVFVVCAAASAATRRVIGMPVFEALGKTGVLVNIARGALVDEPALVRALQDGVIAGAALDVFEDEPNVPAELLTMEHVIVTPHIASATHETRRAMGDLMLDNLDAHFAGRPLPTAVV